MIKFGIDEWLVIIILYFFIIWGLFAWQTANRMVKSNISRQKFLRKSLRWLTGHKAKTQEVQSN